MSRKQYYLAGPMRRHPEFNFPAFDRYAEALRNLMPEAYILSPADRDRSTGFDPVGMTGHEDLTEHGFDIRAALKADTAWICEHADGVIFMPGAGDSKGAVAERCLAEALGLEVWYVGPRPGTDGPDYLWPAGGWDRRVLLSVVATTIHLRPSDLVTLLQTEPGEETTPFTLTPEV